MLKSSIWIKIASLLADMLLLILLAQWSGYFKKADKGDIVIGLAWPVATKNSMLKEGVELAVDEINGQGGINGRKIRLVVKDDEGTVTGGVTVARL